MAPMTERESLELLTQLRAALHSVGTVLAWNSLEHQGMGPQRIAPADGVQIIITDAQKGRDLLRGLKLLATTATPSTAAAAAQTTGTTAAMQPDQINHALKAARAGEYGPDSATGLAQALIALAELVKRERDARVEFDACNISERRRWALLVGVLEKADQALEQAVQP